MPKFKDYPRDGSANGDIINPGEAHVPAVILIDASGSMTPVGHLVTKALQEFKEAIEENSYAYGKVELCIIVYNDDVTIVHPFTSMYDFKVPEIVYGGGTSTHKGIDVALSQIKERKKQYVERKTPYYRPWLFLLTDGYSTDEDNGAYQRLLEAQRNKNCTFFAVGIGNDFNREELKSMHKDGILLTASKENISGALSFLSNSLCRVSDSNPDDKVVLDNPANYQLTIEA